MTRDHFVDELCAIEVSVAQLRANPSGEAWLPTELRRAVEASPFLRDELTAFVRDELALFDDAALPGGAMFTARLMAQIPAQTGVDPARRRLILALSYASAAAVGVGWLLRAGLADGTASAMWDSSWHAWLDALSVGGMALGAALIVTMGALLWPSAGAPLRT